MISSIVEDSALIADAGQSVTPAAGPIETTFRPNSTWKLSPIPKRQWSDGFAKAGKFFRPC
jgi:hypothetical protein